MEYVSPGQTLYKQHRNWSFRHRRKYPERDCNAELGLAILDTQAMPQPSRWSFVPLRNFNL